MDLERALETSLMTPQAPSKPIDDPPVSKINLVRDHLIHLASVVDEHLAMKEKDKMRAAELSVKTCWEELQSIDDHAVIWLKATRAYGLIMERFAVKTTHDRVVLEVPEWE